MEHISFSYFQHEKKRNMVTIYGNQFSGFQSISSQINLPEYKIRPALEVLVKERDERFSNIMRKLLEK